MIVLVLTEQQKDLIVGQQFAQDSYFNPIQDADGEWIVSFEEMIGLENTQFNWLLQCPMKINNPVLIPNFPI